eukprot:g15008.t1 g15008   contig21:344123-344901(-)
MKSTTHPSHHPIRHLLIFVLLLCTSSKPIHAQNSYNHDGGLYGTAKDISNSIIEPIRNGVKKSYDGMSDKGRFCVGMGFGFGCSRVAIGTTVKAVKTVGAAYIAFEALEYAGLLKEARANKNNQKIVEQSRDYLLRTMDGVRHDIRTHLNPGNVKRRIDNCMKRDKPGTVGFGTGAFLGFVL